MKYQEFEKEFIFATYDIPSPDRWKTNYQMIYNFSIDFLIGSPEFDDMEHFDDPTKYNKKGEKKKFYDMLGTQQNFSKLPKPLRNYIGGLRDTGSDANFDVYINKIKLSPTEKVIHLAMLRKKGIPQKPLSPRKNDFWFELTQEQKSHNALIDQGKQGLSKVITKFPNMKNQRFVATGELLRLRWVMSQNLFVDGDIIINPKYLKLIQRGISPQDIPKNIKEWIGIGQAFSSARGVLNSRLKHSFIPIKESVYVVNQYKCFAPNDEDPTTKEPFYNELKDSVRFTWDQRKGFIGEIDKQTKQPKFIRYPDDPSANTFEEIFYSEFMPLFVILREYMKDASTGKFKPKYQYGYDRLFGETFEDWISFLRVKPSNKKAMIQIAKSITRSILNQDPNFLVAISSDIHSKFEDYYTQDNQQLRGHLKRWISNKKNVYLGKIVHYHLSDAITDEYLDDYIANYNKMIEAYNRKTNKKTPKIMGTQKKKRKIAKTLLHHYGWYYTIPNTHFRADIQFKELEAVEERRKQIELELWHVNKKFVEEEQLPEFVKPVVILKDEFIQLEKQKDYDTLINYYEDVLNNPSSYSKPDTYTKWLESLIPKNKMPKKEAVKKEHEEDVSSKKEDLEKEQKELEVLVSKLIKIDVLKKNLTDEEVEAIV